MWFTKSAFFTPGHWQHARELGLEKGSHAKAIADKMCVLNAGYVALSAKCMNLNVKKKKVFL